MTIDLGKFSMGIGDRFGREGEAQLRALLAARVRGVEVTPVWNKSNREHTLLSTRPEDVRQEAARATEALGWNAPYHVDADHIGLGNVDKFLGASDFFTIDVADFIGRPASPASVEAFLGALRGYDGELALPGLSSPLSVSEASKRAVAEKYLAAIEQAGLVYRYITEKKGEGSFITEVSFDEASAAQSPTELLFILAGLAQQKIPVVTVAPKFSGEFLKGIEYVGNVAKFAEEFAADLAVLSFAKQVFSLPSSLKLSIHSGSDKFALYPVMHRALAAWNTGVHLKTAGTTWLEEVIGLASVGGEGAAFVKRLYRAALSRYDELCVPYLLVIDIDRTRLPTAEQVDALSSEQLVEMLRHDASCPRYSTDVRQLLHIAFRIAAEWGGEYFPLLETHRQAVATCVEDNLFQRHIQPLFLGNG